MNKLYERISLLCEQRGIKPGRMCADLGISRGNITDLKMGRIESLSAEKLSMVAAYFNVSVDYLLGTEKEKAPTPEGERDVTFDDFTYAMQNEAKELTEEDKQLLLSMAKQLRNARNDKQNGEAK